MGTKMMNFDREKIKVTARKRAIGAKWGYEVREPMKPMFGINIEREIECQISTIARLKWKRHDDEITIIRRLFG